MKLDQYEAERKKDIHLMGAQYLKNFTLLNYEVDVKLNKAFKYCQKVKIRRDKKFVTLRGLKQREKVLRDNMHREDDHSEVISEDY
jgi:hypothetical protein